ncbi:MAG: BMP family protein, partial [Longimicrobiales bacterium]|nr:BMP family protein [Longimicrobiales bacterium]
MTVLRALRSIFRRSPIPAAPRPVRPTSDYLHATAGGGWRWWRNGGRGFLAATVLFLVGCGGGGDTSGAGGAGDGLQAALLTSGPVSDAGWYAGAYDGLLLVEDSLGARVSHQQTATPAEFDEAFLAYATSGYDLIFAHGFEYQDAAIRAGNQFPDVTIVVSGGGRVADNVVPLIFRLEEGSYLAGMAAAAMTRTGTVGMVGGVAIPPARGTFVAFEAGVHAVDPDIRVLETFTGDWNDVSAAKEAAVAQLSRGADVIIHNLDAASFGVFQAVREAAAEGREVWAVGMNSNQNDVAPDVIIGSAVIYIPEAFLETARRWQAGELGGEPVYADIREGVIDFVFNPELMDRVPEGIVERI